jgi:hypothetical protein
LFADCPAFARKLILTNRIRWANLPPEGRRAERESFLVHLGLDVPRRPHNRLAMTRHKSAAAAALAAILRAPDPHVATIELLTALAARLGDARFKHAAGSFRALAPPGKPASHRYEVLTARSRCSAMASAWVHPTSRRFFSFHLIIAVTEVFAKH